MLPAKVQEKFSGKVRIVAHSPSPSPIIAYVLIAKANRKLRRTPPVAGRLGARSRTAPRLPDVPFVNFQCRAFHTELLNYVFFKSSFILLTLIIS